MIRNAFSHVTHWVFDLDHTLYPPENALFSQIEKKMTDYVMKNLNLTEPQANQMRVQYWQQYGTTLAGLMREHDIDPVPFLDSVHDIDFSVLSPNPELCEAIHALPGRKLIYTNGTKPYANCVLGHLGLGDTFDAIYGVEHAGYSPKPERIAYERVFEQAKVNPVQAAMFEDSDVNLLVPHALGVKTVLVHSASPTPSDHIHFQTSDLTTFLRQIV